MEYLTEVDISLLVVKFHQPFISYMYMTDLSTADLNIF